MNVDNKETITNYTLFTKTRENLKTKRTGHENGTTATRLTINREAIQLAKLHPQHILLQPFCIASMRSKMLIQQSPPIIKPENIRGPSCLEDLRVLIIRGAQPIRQRPQRSLINGPLHGDLLMQKGPLIVISTAPVMPVKAVSLGLVVGPRDGDLLKLLLQVADLREVGLDLAVDDVDGGVLGLQGARLDVVQQAVAARNGGFAELAHVVVGRVQRVEVVRELAHARVQTVVVGRERLQTGHARLQGGGDVGELGFDFVELRVVRAVAARGEAAEEGGHGGAFWGRKGAGARMGWRRWG